MPSNQPCPPGCTCGRHNRATYAGKPVMTPEERRVAQLEYQRRYRAENRDRINATVRVREKTPVRRESKRRYRERNREKLRTDNREYQRAQREARRAGLWEAQDGLCCYCQRPLSGKVDADHDHSHCEGPTGCKVCIRGLAHNNCNVIVGMAREDWELLAAIAASGPALVAQVRQRIEAGPVQEALPLGVTPLAAQDGQLSIQAAARAARRASIAGTCATASTTAAATAAARTPAGVPGWTMHSHAVNASDPTPQATGSTARRSRSIAATTSQSAATAAPLTNMTG